jgi:Protein of unknown function (DUF1059)
LEKVLECDCGFKARAEDEGELVSKVQRHDWEAHGLLSSDQALLITFRAELGETAWPLRPARDAADDTSPDGISDGKEDR